MISGVVLDTKGLERRLREIREASIERLEQVARRAGERTVEILKSYDFTLEPRPTKKGRRRMDHRPRHPGGWADKSGRLARSYDYEVARTGDGVALTILNTDAKATLVEARDGYFVVSGVTEAGGPVDRALREAIAELAPGWEVR
jgi:hypothetical protein